MAIETRILQEKIVFNDWEVKEYIGSGSGGRTAVFKIVRKHDSWEEASALKVINVLEEIGKKDTLADVYRQEYEAERDELCKQAQEELRLMSCLRGNPYIVEYYDFAFVDYQEENVFGTDLLIRMELLENLREKQKREGEFCEAEILHIGKNICKSLQFCHQLGIIHRDIKPANIFVTSWGDYKLGDFGIARMVDAGQKASTKMGTRAYAAPEQFMSHQEKYDERVDIYSLGLTLYELANHNRLPFADSGYVRESEIQLRIMGKELPVPDDVGPVVAEVIKKACMHEVGKRYASAKEFEDALMSVEAGEHSKQEQLLCDKKNFSDKKQNTRTAVLLAVTIVGIILLVVILLVIALWEKQEKDVEESGAVMQEEISEAEVAIEQESDLAENSEKPENVQFSSKSQALSHAYRELFGEVLYVTATDRNVAVITGNHDLYMWGRNDYGQVGCGNTEEQSEPVLIMNQVESVCLSEMHTAAVTTTGELYLWGRNTHGQIGNGNTENQLTPVKVLDDVKTVSLGDYCSGALCNNGDLYGWGDEHGNGTGSDQVEPTLIADDIVDFSMNDCDGGAVTKNGVLFVWGMNWTSQEGFGEPLPVRILDSVESIHVGERTVAAIQKDGDLYVWGYNDHGQIGNGDTGRQATEPVWIMGGVKSVALGEEHSAAVLEDGTLCMWGNNLRGQVGVPGDTGYTKPQKVDEDVAAVYLGEDISAYVKASGYLYLCGKNGSNQIEASKLSVVDEPVAIVGDITSVGIGEKSVYAVGEDGTLYHWGD